ncbi:MAG: hypothetical protein ACSLFR_03835 [Solirubrobacteraceae bacterium]
MTLKNQTNEHAGHLDLSVGTSTLTARAGQDEARRIVAMQLAAIREGQTVTLDEESVILGHPDVIAAFEVSRDSIDAWADTL